MEALEKANAQMAIMMLDLHRLKWSKLRFLMDSSDGSGYRRETKRCSLSELRDSTDRPLTESKIHQIDFDRIETAAAKTYLSDIFPATKEKYLYDFLVVSLTQGDHELVYGRYQLERLLLDPPSSHRDETQQVGGDTSYAKVKEEVDRLERLGQNDRTKELEELCKNTTRDVPMIFERHSEWEWPLDDLCRNRHMTLAMVLKTRDKPWKLSVLADEGFIAPEFLPKADDTQESAYHDRQACIDNPRRGREPIHAEGHPQRQHGESSSRHSGNASSETDTKGTDDSPNSRLAERRLGKKKVGTTVSPSETNTRESYDGASAKSSASILETDIGESPSKTEPDQATALSNNANETTVPLHPTLSGSSLVSSPPDGKRTPDVIDSRTKEASQPTEQENKLPTSRETTGYKESSSRHPPPSETNTRESDDGASAKSSESILETGLGESKVEQQHPSMTEPDQATASSAPDGKTTPKVIDPGAEQASQSSMHSIKAHIDEIGSGVNNLRIASGFQSDESSEDQSKTSSPDPEKRDTHSTQDTKAAPPSASRQEERMDAQNSEAAREVSAPPVLRSASPQSTMMEGSRSEGQRTQDIDSRRSLLEQIIRMDKSNLKKPEPSTLDNSEEEVAEEEADSNEGEWAVGPIVLPQTNWKPGDNAYRNFQKASLRKSNNYGDNRENKGQKVHEVTKQGKAQTQSQEAKVPDVNDQTRGDIHEESSSTNVDERSIFDHLNPSRSISHETELERFRSEFAAKAAARKLAAKAETHHVPDTGNLEDPSSPQGASIGLVPRGNDASGGTDDSAAGANTATSRVTEDVVDNLNDVDSSELQAPLHTQNVGGLQASLHAQNFSGLQAPLHAQDDRVDVLNRSRANSAEGRSESAREVLSEPLSSTISQTQNGERSRTRSDNEREAQGSDPTTDGAGAVRHSGPMPAEFSTASLYRANDISENAPKNPAPNRVAILRGRSQRLATSSDSSSRGNATSGSIPSRKSAQRSASSSGSSSRGNATSGSTPSRKPAQRSASSSGSSSRGNATSGSTPSRRPAQRSASSSGSSSRGNATSGSTPSRRPAQRSASSSGSFSRGSVTSGSTPLRGPAQRSASSSDESSRRRNNTSGNAPGGASRGAVQRSASSSRSSRKNGTHGDGPDRVAAKRDSRASRGPSQRSTPSSGRSAVHTSITPPPDEARAPSVPQVLDNPNLDVDLSDWGGKDIIYLGDWADPA